jgi:putative phosphoribosyl transferase
MIRSTSSATVGALARPVSLWCDSVELAGNLLLPDGARGVVIAGVGHEGGWLAGCEDALAHHLGLERVGTLRIELLTAAERVSDCVAAGTCCDTPLLARRLICAADWLQTSPLTSELSIGYFGGAASAAAALWAAARRPAVIDAIVTVSARIDLAGPAVVQVCAPTLLVVTVHDTAIIQINRGACSQMHGKGQVLLLSAPEGASEQAATLLQVAHVAGDWFKRYLVPPAW